MTPNSFVNMVILQTQMLYKRQFHTAHRGRYASPSARTGHGFERYKLAEMVSRARCSGGVAAAVTGRVNRRPRQLPGGSEGRDGRQGEVRGLPERNQQSVAPAPLAVLHPGSSNRSAPAQAASGPASSPGRLGPGHTGSSRAIVAGSPPSCAGARRSTTLAEGPGERR
jgi:hypothetical protein